MQYAKFTMKPVALLVAILLGGCVGYTGYPSGDYGSYSQPPTAKYSRRITANADYGTARARRNMHH